MPLRRDARMPPGPGQVSVWDFPRPPRIEPVAAPVRVEFNGEVVADSSRVLRVCETASPPTYYIPPDDVRLDLLAPAPTSSYCEWKGHAVYWTLRVGRRSSHAAAWSYPQPTAAYAALRGYLAFYASRVDACHVGDARVTPQPGGFYGGWITPDVVGPFKGEPGTGHW